MTTQQNQPIKSQPPVIGNGRAMQGVAEINQWIADNEGRDGLNLCSNSMLSRGDVYRCRIENGRAIAYQARSWWAMAFSHWRDIEPAIDLGRLVAGQNRSGTAWTVCQELENGQLGLRYGNG